MKKIPVFPRRFMILAAFLALSAGSRSAPPAWWSEGDPPAVDPNSEQNNRGPANIGQAKWMAKSALNALRSVSPSLASQVETDLVGSGKPIPNWDPPADQAGRDRNHAPLLIGQLKAIAAPFYEALHTEDSGWLNRQLSSNQTKDAGSSSNYYPWSSTTTDDQNIAPATIGQLKAVFSLRFEALQDSDGDGFLDSYEVLIGSNPDNFDTDADGIPDGKDESPVSVDALDFSAGALMVISPLN